MDRFWSLLFLAVPVLGLLIVLGVVFNVGLHDAWLPESIGPRTKGIDYLFNLFHIIVAVVFVGTGLLLAFSLFRFRATNRKVASYVHKSIWLELLWTIIPAGTLVFLAMHQLPYWQANKEDHRAFEPAGAGSSDLETPTVRVVAYQFGWRFIYPGLDGTFDTRDDVISENLLVLPSHQEIVAELRSMDVIHSFAINKLRLKQDIVPGLSPRIWFMITQNGDWEINCMELCGWGHFRMSARLRTVSPNDFEDWLMDIVQKRGY